MIILIGVTLVLLMSANDASSPFEASSKSYGFYIDANQKGTEFRYTNPATDVKGTHLNSPQVRIEDAKLNLDLVTPMITTVLSKHPKLSVEGTSPGYHYKLVDKKDNKVKHQNHGKISQRNSIRHVKKSSRRRKISPHHHDPPDEEQPEPDIPIELGIEDTASKEKQKPITNTRLNGNSCDNKSCENNEPVDKPVNAVSSGEEIPLFDNEGRSSGESSADYNDQSLLSNELFDTEDLSFPPKAPEVPIELGSAIEEEDRDSSKVIVEIKGKRKPGQKNCDASNGCPPDELPPQPDIPIELGSAFIGDQNFLIGDMEGEDNPMYLPFDNLPKKFLVTEDREKTLKENFERGNFVQDHETPEDLLAYYFHEKLAKNKSRDKTSNDDGDFDGELFTNSLNSGENNKKKNIFMSFNRRRRSLLSTDEATGKNKFDNVNRKYSFMASKRSGVDEGSVDNSANNYLETNSTVDNIGNKEKPIQRYVKKLADDVRSVMGEAKSVLRNTGRVVHGLKRVINGATVLTSFTNNAVKFAKYFSMEPNNATIDYLEEKAIVAILEAQRAAKEARDAAQLAKLASEKAQAAERRMEFANQRHKNVEAILPLVRIANKQSLKAAKAAKYAAQKEHDTENDVKFMNSEISKMGVQLHISKKLQQSKDSSVKLENKEQPVKAKKIPKKDMEQTSDLPGNSEKKEKGENKTKNSYKDYFYKKQKQLEEALKDKSVQETSIAIKELLNEMQKVNETGKLPADDVAAPVESHKISHHKNQTKMTINVTPQNAAVPAASNAAVSEISTLDSPFEDTHKSFELGPFNDDQNNADERQYIASLNRKIASIKQEEAEAKQKLKAIELARAFSVFTKEHLRGFDDPEVRANLRRTINERKLEDLLPSLTNYDKTSLQSLEQNISKKDVTIENVGKKKENTAKKHKLSTLKKKHAKEKQPKEHKTDETLIKEELEGLESGGFSSDNTLVGDDFNDENKKEKVLYESKLITDKLSNIDHEINGKDSARILGGEEKSGKEDKTNLFESYNDKLNKEAGYKQLLKRGPLSVTVKVNHNSMKNDTVVDKKKTSDILDTLGLNDLETNEKGIVERTKIPQPDDYYKVVYQRSFIPHPKSEPKNSTSSIGNGIFD